MLEAAYGPTIPSWGCFATASQRCMARRAIMACRSPLRRRPDAAQATNSRVVSAGAFGAALQRRRPAGSRRRRRSVCHRRGRLRGAGAGRSGTIAHAAVWDAGAGASACTSS